MHNVRVITITSNAHVRLDLLVTLPLNVYEFLHLVRQTKTVLKVTRVETQCVYLIVDLIRTAL